MKLVVTGFIFSLVVLVPLLAEGASVLTKESPLFMQIKLKDSLLFDKGFNQCDAKSLDLVIAEDFEFYHDESGITKGKQLFIESFMNGVCDLDYKATRRLIEDSLLIYPLKNNGIVYGAIQIGEHHFYAQYAAGDEKPPELTSTAHFTHVWELRDNNWLLIRVLSYGHQ